MKQQKLDMPLLPLDMVVEISFFIPEWNTLELFMRALRPANALGLLEHLWQLKQLKWDPSNLWPHLNLTKMDELSRFHIECIAKYYSNIKVDKTVDPLWLRRHTNHSIRIQWWRSQVAKTSDCEWLTQWKHFRLTKINGGSRHTPNRNAPLLIENLPYYKYLVELSWYGCNSAVVSAIFQYAATSSTLRRLDIHSFKVGHVDRCTITSSMAKNLLNWVTLQPIQDFTIGNFTWEDFSLRNQVASAMLNFTTIERFWIHCCDAANTNLEWSCGYHDSTLCIDFGNPRRRFDFEAGILLLQDLILDEVTGDLSGLVQPFFQSLLNPKVKKLRLTGYGIFANCVIWEMVIPYLQQSHLEELDLRWNYMRDPEALLLAEGIRSMRFLEKINLVDNRLSYTGLKAIFTATPATLNYIFFFRTIKELTEKLLSHECDELLELAGIRSIFLFHR
ncbi:hypothetical protein LEN26_001520 [Aphanomyces euteiches]|nr:hypothetical protein AeMF1_021095 [Aphanomyces euteiches]KAH9161241.1 hypothetical protein LEN26_001520 [Aphanomyces euteiches]